MDATANIWPLQASSPEPDRWRDWAKQFKAAVIGMPQWTEEELLAMYVTRLIFLFCHHHPSHVVR